MTGKASISTKPSISQRRLWVSRVSMALLGGVLVLSGGIKALDLNLFVHQVQSYGLFTQPQLTALTAWVITTLECFLGAALLCNYRPRPVLNLTLLLLVVFTFLTLYAALQGSVEDCGCFGALVKRTPGQAAMEDGVLLILCVIAKRGIPTGSGPGAWWRALIAIGLSLFGALLPFFSGVPAALLAGTPSQSGTIWAELKVEGVDGVDLGTGTHLVVLMSVSCQHCQEAVPELGMLMDTLPSRTLSIVALGQDSVEDQQAFIAEWDPPYPIGRIAGEAFWTLLEDGELPRIMLVEAGQTIGVWDHTLPTAQEIIALLDR
jgi:uncharacterized membrane protein